MQGRSVSRRDFLKATSAAATAAAAAQLGSAVWAAAPDRRPNIVLLVGEDMSADLGCYGVQHAHTPNLDRLASEGARYAQCFTHCGVCAPSRSGMITGQYPTALGTHHHRSTLVRPPALFTHALQRSGYEVIWTNKTDFNFKDSHCRFDSKRDWTEGDLPTDRPFFAFFNVFTTHESQVRANAGKHAENTQRLQPADRQDPATIPLPPFYPDVPEVRNDVRQYHELCTAVDYKVGDVMTMLQRKGLADNTVLIFTSDHGRGMPRMKRWVYDDGTRLPLIVRWPGQVKPGTVVNDLVAMVDLPATVLSIAGVDIPQAFHGRPYLGPASQNAPARQYVYAHRDRMDETYDRIRSVRDARYRYVRNYQPEVPYAAYINYNEENPIMQAWRRLARQHQLNPEQQAFFARTKPAEEFYDCAADPHQIKNLTASGDPAIKARLTELRSALDAWIAHSGDLGAVPERELIARGLVADRLGDEYEKRLALHPQEPPYVE